LKHTVSEKVEVERKGHNAITIVRLWKTLLDKNKNANIYLRKLQIL